MRGLERASVVALTQDPAPAVRKRPTARSVKGFHSSGKCVYSQLTTSPSGARSRTAAQGRTADDQRRLKVGVPNLSRVYCKNAAYIKAWNSWTVGRAETKSPCSTTFVLDPQGSWPAVHGGELWAQRHPRCDTPPPVWRRDGPVVNLRVQGRLCVSSVGVRHADLYTLEACGTAG
jgi:hypothetical protein